MRTSQNWIGRAGSTIKTADFVPPPPGEVADLLADWERFAHDEPEMPLLVQDALLHAQFETIHPFLDEWRITACSRRSAPAHEPSGPTSPGS